MLAVTSNRGPGPCFHLLLVVWNHFLLIEAADALPEDIMVLVEDPAGPDVHQGLGAGGLRAGRGDLLPKLLGLTVQPGRN